MWVLGSSCPGSDLNLLCHSLALGPGARCSKLGAWFPHLRMEIQRVPSCRVAVKIKSNLTCGPLCDKYSTNVSTQLLSDPEQVWWARLEKLSNTQVGFSL